MGVTKNSIRIVRGEPDRVSDILRLLQEAAGGWSLMELSNGHPDNLPRPI